MKQIKDEWYPEWRSASLYVPACNKVIESGTDWNRYESSPVLCVDSENNFHLCYVQETRYSDQSFYEWAEVGRDGYYVDDVVYWQSLPAKPDEGRR